MFIVYLYPCAAHCAYSINNNNDVLCIAKELQQAVDDLVEVGSLVTQMGNGSQCWQVEDYAVW